MKYLLSILCLFILSCDSGGDDAVEVEGCTDVDACNFNADATIDDASCDGNCYFEDYMILVDGAIDENEINPLGSTSPSGTLEYNNKGSFPHLFGLSNIEMLHTDEFSTNIGSMFTMADLTQGEFNLILKNNLTEQNYYPMNDLAPLLIQDKVNTFDIVLLHDNSYNVNLSVSDGEFNLIFNINYENDLPVENINILLQYVLDCNPDIFWWCGEGGNSFINENRPTTTFELYTPCFENEVNIKIELLDGTLIEESTISDLGCLGSNSYTFVSPQELITSGIQIFKYSVDFLNSPFSCSYCDGAGSITLPPSDNYTANYPNPFN